MKKNLLSTSAIALGVAALAAPVSAQEWDMTWGGFFTSHVGYVTVDTDTGPQVGADYDGVDTLNTGEITFSPSITLDNGLTFGVTVDYETTINAGAQVDDSFMSISSDTLGKIDIGNTNSAGYNMMVAAPYLDGTIWINSPSISGFIPISVSAGGNLPWNFQSAAISSYTEVLGNDDVPRISYYTPSFNGLTLGVSYAASATGVNSGNNFGVNRNVGVNDVFDIAVAYSQSFNGVDINVAGRYGMASNDTGAGNDPEAWGIGGTIGVAGWTFGGAYSENDNGGLTPDEEGWGVAVTYDMEGPWAVNFGTYQGEWSGVGNGDKAEYEAYELIANRDLGAGVSWAIYAVYAEGTVNDNLGGTFLDNVGGNLANTSVDGTLIGTSVNLYF